MTAIALQSAAPRQSSVPSPDVRHTARCAPRRRRFRRRRLSSARVSTGPVARDSRGWLRRLLALTTRPAVNCWCCERRRRVQRRSSSVLPARSGKPSAAVPQPSPSRAAAQKRCAPHAPHSCVSDVFHAIIIMLKIESVCTFCWGAWCWSLDQDQTCCVLARLSCTGHPMKACDARTSPRPCDTSTIRLRVVFRCGSRTGAPCCIQQSYITSGLLPDACSATRSSWEFLEKNDFERT